MPTVRRKVTAWWSVPEGPGLRPGRYVGAAVAAFLALVTAGALFGEQARVNRKADPYGRIVDVTFDQDVAVTAPWDRFRFGVDLVQPLTRQSGAFLGDLDGDGVRDLLLASWDSSLVFVPGIAGHERLFGAGTLLRHTTASPSADPFDFGSGDFLGGAIGDLDGDGSNDAVIGNVVYRNVGTAPAVLLEQAYAFTTFGGGWDPAVSLGDLDGDGDLDAVVTYNYAFGDAHVFWNDSAPGSFAFTHQLIADTPMGWQPDNRLALGDLDGDGRLDLAGADGVYFNTGTAQVPAWNIFTPSPWNVSGGPPWQSGDDLGTDLVLVDADGDGDLDAYASGVEDTVWQALYYRNEGTRAAHHLVYVGPVLARESPVSIAHRGSNEPTLSASAASPTSSDVDGDGRADLTIGGSLFSAGAAVLWRRADSPPLLTYPDLHTWPPLPLVNDLCGGDFWAPREPLCSPPTNILAWVDVDGDGLSDALASTTQRDESALVYYPRLGTWPFTLNAGPPPIGAPQPLLTLGSGTPVRALGVTFTDIDIDGISDLVAGWEDGTLRWYRNTATAGLALADAVPLANASAVPIDAGDEAWPTAIDLDGDNDLDFLVGTDDGPVRQVLCVTPGVANGYALGGLLGVTGQNPLDVTGVVGGGYNGLSLFATDHDGDSLVDVVAGDHAGRVWLLRRGGTAQAPVFAMEPVGVERTTAAYLAVLGPASVRLRFATPILANQTTLTYYQVPTAGGPITGAMPVVVPDPQEVTVLDGAVEVASAQGSAVDLGPAVLGGPGAPRTFTVRNDGGDDLALGAVVVPAGFTLVEPLDASLPAGLSDTFTIALDTSTAGAKSGEVTFATDDADENPYRVPVAGTVVAAPPRRFDFGTAGSPVAATYTRVTQATAYASGTGFGWLSGTVASRERASGSDLTRDINFTTAATFVLDLENGSYDVSLMLGDMGAAHDQVGVFLQGTLVDTVTTAAAQVLTGVHRVTVVDHRLVVTLDDLGGSDVNAAIVALTVVVAGDKHFDFGTASSPVAASFTRVTHTTAYDQTRGHGWLAGTLASRDRATGGDLARDFVFSRDAIFAVDVANGPYSVLVTMGDAAGGHDQMGVYLEGTPVDTVSAQAGPPAGRWYQVTVGDNQLTVGLKDLGGSDPNAVINGLEVLAGTWPTVVIPATDLPVALPSSQTRSSSIAVSSLPGVIADVDVRLEIAHTWDNDLDVFLVGPTGTRVELFTDVGSNGHDFTGTVLDDEAADSILTGAPPFTGAFRPEGSLAAFDGTPAAGTWTLEITDDTAGDDGVLLAWSITIATQGPPPPRAFDFGIAGSPLEAGFTAVLPTSAYSSLTGWGWSAGTVEGRSRTQGTALQRDLNFSKDATFLVNVPDGSYQARVTVGDAAAGHDQVGIYLEGVLAGSLTTSAGHWVANTYPVTVSDGQLTIRIKDLGGSDVNAVINGLEILE